MNFQKKKSRYDYPQSIRIESKQDVDKALDVLTEALQHIPKEDMYIPSPEVHKACLDYIETHALGGDRNAMLWVLERTMPKAAPQKLGVLPAYALTAFGDNEDITPRAIEKRLVALANLVMQGRVSLDVVAPIQNLLAFLLHISSERKAHDVVIHRTGYTK